MKSIQRLIGCLATSLVAGLLLQGPAPAWDPPDAKSYMPSFGDIQKAKRFYDDPRSPYAGALSLKNRVPKEMYEKLVFPVDEMKKEWAAVVGFKAPDVVNKKCPDIKPGKYTYKDLEKYPCFKELFPSETYNRIKPGGPPHAGNIPEFEIVPTQQYYHSLPVARMTKENAPKVKTDEKGYLKWQTWDGGYPFPRPSGPNKALQVMYNVEKRYFGWDGSFTLFEFTGGYRKDLSVDFEGTDIVRHLKLTGRSYEPLGWFDQRAKDKGEQRQFVMDFKGPRDYIGTAMSGLYYLEANKADLLMVYVPQLRRIRMLTSTDAQDPIQGQDLIYDDNEGFLQKLSPARFPYKWEVLEETEYLMQVCDGTGYLTKKGLEMRNVKFMRRPVYVVQGKQLDPNYVYSKRIFYVDRETFMFDLVLNYDRKGRLYRSVDIGKIFEPDMGVFHMGGAYWVLKDHIDLHSNVILEYQLPAFWKRKDVSLEQYLGAK
jgi:hypothetical protein